MAWTDPLSVSIDQAIAGHNYPTNRWVWHGIGDLTLADGGLVGSIWYKDNGPKGLDPALVEPRAFCTKGEVRFTFTGNTLIVRLNVAWSWFTGGVITIDGVAPSTLGLLTAVDTLNCDAAFYNMPSGGYLDILVADGLVNGPHDVSILINSTNASKYWSMAGYKVGVLDSLTLARTGGWLVPTSALLPQNKVRISVTNQGDNFVFNASLTFPAGLVTGSGHALVSLAADVLAPKGQIHAWPDGETISQIILPAFVGDEQSSEGDEGLYTYDFTLSGEYYDPDGVISRTPTINLLVGSSALFISQPTFFNPVIPSQNQSWAIGTTTLPFASPCIHTSAFESHLRFVFSGDVLFLTIQQHPSYGRIGVYAEDNTTLLHSVSCYAETPSVPILALPGFGVGHHVIYLRKIVDDTLPIAFLSASSVIGGKMLADSHGPLFTIAYGAWSYSAPTPRTVTSINASTYGESYIIVEFVGDSLLLEVLQAPGYGDMAVIADDETTVIRIVPCGSSTTRVYTEAIMGFGEGNHTVFLAKNTDDDKVISFISASPIDIPTIVKAGDSALETGGGLWNYDTGVNAPFPYTTTATFGDYLKFTFIGDVLSLNVLVRPTGGDFGIYAANNTTLLAHDTCFGVTEQFELFTLPGFGGGNHTVYFRKWHGLPEDDTTEVTFQSASPILREPYLAYAGDTGISSSGWVHDHSGPTNQFYLKTTDVSGSVSFTFVGDALTLTTMRDAGYGDLGIYAANNVTLLDTVSCDATVLPDVPGLYTQTLTGYGGGNHTLHLRKIADDGLMVTFVSASPVLRTPYTTVYDDLGILVDSGWSLDPPPAVPERYYTSTVGINISFTFAGDSLTLTVQQALGWGVIGIYDDPTIDAAPHLLGIVDCGVDGGGAVTDVTVSGFGVGNHTVYLRKRDADGFPIIFIAASPVIIPSPTVTVGDNALTVSGAWEEPPDEDDPGFEIFSVRAFTSSFGKVITFTFVDDELTVTVQRNGGYGDFGIYAEDNTTLLHTISCNGPVGALHTETFSTGLGTGNHVAKMRKKDNDSSIVIFVSASPIIITSPIASAGDPALTIGGAGWTTAYFADPSSPTRAFTKVFGAFMKFTFRGDELTLVIQRDTGRDIIDIYDDDNTTLLKSVSCDVVDPELPGLFTVVLTDWDLGPGDHTIYLRKHTDDTEAESPTFIVFISASPVIAPLAYAGHHDALTVIGDWVSTNTNMSTTFIFGLGRVFPFVFLGNVLLITVYQVPGWGLLGIYADEAKTTLLAAAQCSGNYLTRTIALTGFGLGSHTVYLDNVDPHVGMAAFISAAPVMTDVQAGDSGLTIVGTWETDEVSTEVTRIFTTDNSMYVSFTFQGDAACLLLQQFGGGGVLGIYDDWDPLTHGANLRHRISCFGDDALYIETLTGFGPGDHTVYLALFETSAFFGTPTVFFVAATWPVTQTFTERSETVRLTYSARQPVALPVTDIEVGDFDVTFAPPTIDTLDYSGTPVRENTDLEYTEVLSRFPTYAVCYQGGYRDILAQYDILIVDPIAARTADVLYWQSKGIEVYGYIASGEEVGFYRDRYDFTSELAPNAGDGLGPGGYASYYMYTKFPETGPPDKNGVWASYYVNCDPVHGWPQRVDNYYAPLVLDGPLVVSKEVVTLKLAQISAGPVLVFDTVNSPLDGEEPMVLTTFDEAITFTTYQDYIFDAKTGAVVMNGTKLKDHQLAVNEQLKFSYTRKGHFMEGVFWDVVDTPDVYLSHTFEFGYAFVEGYDVHFINFLNNFKINHPNAKMISNRGFTILPKIIHSCAGVMFESWLTTATDIEHLFTTDYMRITSEGGVAYNQNVNELLLRLRKTNTFDVYSLNYALADSRGDELRNYCRVEDAKRGYLSWQSTITLDVPAPNTANITGATTGSAIPGLPSNSFVRFKTKRI